ncbi:hypothetical protein G6F68_021799 [Rhizopus microsporus]|nr:hypothetical protein G6F68_021799 [Rhizopus microsporus]
MPASCELAAAIFSRRCSGSSPLDAADWERLCQPASAPHGMLLTTWAASAARTSVAWVARESPIPPARASSMNATSIAAI